MGMRFYIIGAGPAGLYLAFLLKRSHPRYEVRVFEQNAPDVTFGFGVVLSGRALNFVAEVDNAIVERISRYMQSWKDQHIIHKGVQVVIDGNSFSAIERLLLLQEMQGLCREVGVEIEFNSRVPNSAEHANCDVLVGADGANSAVRDSHIDAFGTRIMDLRNYFAWYGVEVPYAAHSLTFRRTKDGVFCAHHYRYTPTKSTFVGEVDSDTWHRSGMSTMDDEERRKFTQEIFSDTLFGKPLVANRSIWKRWRLVTNDRWNFKNIVLIGDALRTAHPSIGSGTRLAMEDSIALWRAFEAEGNDVAAALNRYERERKLIRDKLNRAGELSIAWYEEMASKMDLSPYNFAYDYMLRTNVMTAERLANESPDFMSRYRHATLMATA
jgi:2-polyprenyl-6-methoxyphenol hydroxylase-like FAD-dependent oxidoreductase